MKGQKLNLDELGEREFDINQIFSLLKRSVKVWSWGAHAWKYKSNKWLRFKSNGHHHKGHVYITLAWNDTFTVYFTSTKGTIEDLKENVYIDQLIDVIDKKIEFIDKYQF